MVKSILLRDSEEGKGKNNAFKREHGLFLRGELRETSHMEMQATLRMEKQHTCLCTIGSIDFPPKFLPLGAFNGIDSCYGAVKGKSLEHLVI